MCGHMVNIPGRLAGPHDHFTRFSYHVSIKPERIRSGVCKAIRSGNLEADASGAWETGRGEEGRVVLMWDLVSRR